MDTTEITEVCFSASAAPTAVPATRHSTESRLFHIQNNHSEPLTGRVQLVRLQIRV